MGIEDITRDELLTEIFAKLDPFLDEPVPDNWFTINEYAKTKGISYEKARRTIYKAHDVGVLDRQQRKRHTYYFEKEV